MCIIFDIEEFSSAAAYAATGLIEDTGDGAAIKDVSAADINTAKDLDRILLFTLISYTCYEFISY